MLEAAREQKTSGSLTADFSGLAEPVDIQPPPSTSVLPTSAGSPVTRDEIQACERD